MDCFGFMQDVFFEAYPKFLQEVDSARSEMLKVDVKEIEIEPVNICLDKMDCLPDGRWNTLYDNINFECFFHYKDTGILYVILNGALVSEPPRFSRWSYYKFMNGSMLNISDPMCRIYEGLKLGWYYGSKEENLQKSVAEFVLRIAKMYNIKPENIVFLGSSGGGAAAIGCAHWIVGAKVIAINPQIMLNEYELSEEFTNITDIDLSIEDRWNRNDMTCYLNSCERNFQLLFVNIRSRDDMKQIENICAKRNLNLKYGLNICESMVIWLFDGDLHDLADAHDVQGNYCIFFLLQWIIQHSQEREELEKYCELFALINEFYYETIRVEYINRKCMPELKYVKKCAQSNRKVAVWGKGAVLNYLNDELLKLEEDNPYCIEYVMDSDWSISGTYMGAKIIHPFEINDWMEYYFIITTNLYYEEIKQQLEQRGLIYEEDFIYYQDLYKS